MKPDQADRILELVAEALERTPAERPAFLREACGGDDTLRAEVQSLVDREASAGEFLNTPALAKDGSKLFDSETGELRPDDTLGDCRIVRLLGEGGMGEVYLAQDTKLERLVAVKLLKSQFDDDALLRRFRHERKVLAALTHPGIARLYGGATTQEGRSYLVIEYVQGERLDRYCEANHLGVTERLTLFRKVCAAVSYAHQNLIVHRDLKPANIRVTSEGEPKLLDFGIAKLLEPEDTISRPDPTVTMHGAMTPEYASPEQIKGEPITTASDVYSLGVVLFELLTGQRPYAHFKGRRPDELARAICEEEPPRPSTVASQTSFTTVTAAVTAVQGPAARPSATRLRRRLKGDLDNIVAKALRKEPARRYASVAAFSDDIRRHCERLPVSARQDTLGYRTGKFIRRNKTGVTAAALVVLALVTGLVVAIWQARLARQERDRTQLALRQAERIDDFLQNLLASADPTKLGKDVRMVQVIDAAAVNLDRDLANEPEVLLQAHLTLSRTYRNLGVYEPAEQQGRAALTLARRLRGDESLITAGVEYTLGEILANRHLTPEAESLLRHALSIYRAQTPPDRAALAGTLANLGYTLYIRPERAAEAEALFAEALDNARAAWGERDPKYLRVLNQYATLAAGKRDFARAEGMFRQILSLQEQIAPGSVATLTPQINLCVCLFNQEKLDDCEAALHHLDADVQRLVGDNSYPFAYTLMAHGVLKMRRGENGTAIPYLQRALGPLNATFASDFIVVVQCEAVLGLCLTRDNQTVEGEKWLRTAYDHGGKTDRADFAHTFGNLETALGECLLAQKRYPDAEPLLLTGYDDLEKRLGAQNRLTIEATHRLHDLYLAWNKPTEAARFAGNETTQPSPTP